MTPQQITEYKAVIAASPTLTALAASGNDAAFAAALSDALPAVPKPETYIGERGIYSLLGLEPSETFLQTIEVMADTVGPMQSTFMRVARWLQDDRGLDVGHSQTQQVLLGLVPPFSADSVAKIIAYGSQKQKFTIEEVSQLR
jgi:hypothetical protein